MLSRGGEGEAGGRWPPDSSRPAGERRRGGKGSERDGPRATRRTRPGTKLSSHLGK